MHGKTSDQRTGKHGTSQPKVEELTDDAKEF